MCLGCYEVLLIRRISLGSDLVEGKIVATCLFSPACVLHMLFAAHIARLKEADRQTAS